MAEHSQDLPLGTVAPDFALPDVVSGRMVRGQDVRGAQGTLVMFICNHCPYVKHIEQEIARVAGDYAPKGLGLVAIASNDAVEYPEDAPEHLKEQAQRLGFGFPYLYDESQQVARAYQAACTPEFYLFDGAGRLYYHGQLDDARPNRGKPGYVGAPNDGKDLRGALDALLAGRVAPMPQKPSVGCSIKWK